MEFGTTMLSPGEEGGGGLKPLLQGLGGLEEMGLNGCWDEDEALDHLSPEAGGILKAMP